MIRALKEYGYAIYMGAYLGYLDVDVLSIEYFVIVVPMVALVVISKNNK